jgi:hypothetical protein
MSTLLRALLLMAMYASAQAAHVLHHVRIHTLDPARPVATAMAWDDQGQLLALGCVATPAISSACRTCEHRG